MDFTKDNIRNGKYLPETIEAVVHEYRDNKKSFVTIGKEQGVSKYIIRQVYKQSGLPVRDNTEKSMKYTVNDDYFENIDCEEKAYWLGFMYADGYITKERKHSKRKIGISLSTIDKKHLEKFKKAIEFTGNIKDYIVKTSGYKIGTKYSRIIITSEKIAQDLINHGCLENKTDILRFPDENIVPKEYQIDFIRGLIDGDGSVIIINNKNSKYPEYNINFTGTKNMCEAISLILLNKIISLHKRHKDRDNDNYSIIIGGNLQVTKILNILYGNATIYLDRKYKKYKQIIALEQFKDELNPNKPNHYPIKVRCIETGKVYNSCAEAAHAHGLSNGAGIGECIKGLRNEAANLHWEKVEEGE